MHHAALYAVQDIDAQSASLAVRSFSIAFYDLRGPASVYNLSTVYDLRM